MNWFTTYDLLNREGPFTHCVDYILWYVLALALVGVGIFFLVKYKSQKATKIVLIVLWAVTVALDLTKLIVNICTGFSLKWDVPLYICSLFMYVMPFAIWGKGKVKDAACTYICTIGIMGAILNYIFASVTNNYSLFSFFGFHTTLYHTILWAAPLIMLATGYCKLKFKDFGWAFLGFVIITIPVVIFDFITKTDYMYFAEGGVPVVEDIAAKLSYATPLLMYVLYAIAMIIMQSIVIGIAKLVEIIVKAIKGKAKNVDASSDTTNTEKTLEEAKKEK